MAFGEKNNTLLILLEIVNDDREKKNKKTSKQEIMHWIWMGSRNEQVIINYFISIY